MLKSQQVALVIIYNHRYDQNIEIVERIYQSRFSHIYHLVPFYDGHKENVIPVYEHSWYFHGFVAQGFKSYFKEEYDHYFFIADDMIINPVINENNYTHFFQLGKDTNYIPCIYTASSAKGYWSHNIRILKFNLERIGVEVVNLLPSKEEATKRLEALGIKNKSFSYKQVYKRQTIRRRLESIVLFFVNKFIYHVSLKKGLRYPMARGYADIFIIAKSNMEKFVQYCGVFAATDLFVEVAIPTAIALSAKEIKFEKELQLRGRALWSEEELASLEIYHYDLETLLQNFPESYIFLHPIKLSQWKTE